MKKIILCFSLFCLTMTAFGQQPLTLSKVITVEGVNAQNLYDLTLNWMTQMYKDSNSFLKKEGEEITGNGYVSFSTNMMYSSIKGKIEYSINVQFKDGKLRLSMGSFKHVPEIVALYNNDMGILLDSLPNKLEEIEIKGANRKAAYKYYFKHGKPLCETEFEKLAANLKTFIDNRNSSKEDW